MDIVKRMASNLEPFIGIGILGIIAYLFSRSKGSSNIPQIDPLDEVIIRNTKLQTEEFLQRRNEISAIQNRLEVLPSLIQKRENRLEELSNFITGSLANQLQSSRISQELSDLKAEQQKLLLKNEAFV